VQVNLSVHERKSTRIFRSFLILALGLCSCGCVKSTRTCIHSSLATPLLEESVDVEPVRDVLSNCVQLEVIREITDSKQVVTTSAEEEELATDQPAAPSKLAAFKNGITATQSTQELCLEDLEQIALTNNPTLQQSEAVVQQARGRRVHAGRIPNPVIGYVGGEIGAEGTAGQQGGFISQEIVTANKLRLNRDVVDQEIDQALWELQAQRLRILNDIRALYYDVISAQEAVELAKQLQRIAQQGVTVVQDLLKLKQRSLPDVRQAEIELNEVGILLDTSQNRYAAAWRRLTSVLGQADMQPIPLQGHLDEKRAKLIWEETLECLLTESPELQAAQSNVRRAASQLRRECVDPIPNLNLQVGVQQDHGTQDTIANVQLAMVLPVFYRNKGAIDAAWADLRRAQQEVFRLELVLRNRLATSFLRYENAHKRIHRYREKILPKSQENLDLTTEGYQKFSEFSFIQVLTARRTYFQTHLKYIQSLTELRKAESEIAGLLLTGALENVPLR